MVRIKIALHRAGQSSVNETEVFENQLKGLLTNGLAIFFIKKLTVENENGMDFFKQSISEKNALNLLKTCFDDFKSLFSVNIHNSENRSR